MVAGAFALDPLAHTQPDRGIEIVSKTGTDDGVRADVGIAGIGSMAVAYAVIANWDPPDAADAPRDLVMAHRRDLGRLLRRHLETSD